MIHREANKKMRKITKSIDYMSKDYDGFKKMMIEAIPSIIPEWTDYSDDDFGIAMIELLSYGLDILSYYQDKTNNENFLATSRTRRAVINICKYVLGYTLKQAVPAIHNIVFKKVDAFINQEIVIHAGTLVGTDPKYGNQIIFELADTLVLPPGVLGDEKDSNGRYIYMARAIHGKTIREELGYGTGEASQKYILSKTSVLIDTLKVWTQENGVIKDWNQVADFLDSNSTSRDYMASVNENKLTTIEFGDGLAGMKPKDTQPLFAVYRVGGGTIGNVGQNKINSFVSSEVVGIDSLFNPEQPVQYGTNEESLNSAKILAPRMFKTNERAVTASDFEAFACKVPGVLRAKCIETFNENGDVLIYIATSDRNGTSDDFKKLVKDKLDSRRLVNNNVIVKDAEYLDYDVDVLITTYSEYANDSVKANAERLLSTLLSLDNYDFDDNITKSMINKELMIQDYIYDVEINNPTVNVVTQKIQIPRVRNITVQVTGGID